MKKGKSFSQFRLKIYVCLRSGFFYALLAFLATFLSAAIHAYFNISDFAKSGGASVREYSDLFFSLAAAIITAYGAIRSGIALYHTHFSRQLIDSSMVKHDIIENSTKKISSLYIKSKYNWGEYNNEAYLYSNRIDDALIDSDLRIKVIPHKMRMNNNQKQLLYSIVKRKLAKGTIIFNGTMVKLGTDLLIDDDKVRIDNKQEIVVQKTDYFSNITSNDIVYTQAFETDFSKLYKGQDMTIDSAGSLYDLSYSPAANIIGVTTLAITSDGYAILNVQSNSNDVNNGRLVPSGSGSADFDDLLNKSGKNADIKAAKKELKKARNSLKTTRKTVLCCNAKTRVGDKTEPSDYSNYYKERDEYKNKLNEYRYLTSMRRYECSLNAFLIKGMQRELKEESYLSDDDIKCTHVCGYIRILDRGGKPDFFGITLLNCTKDEAFDKFKKGKNKYVYKEISKKKQIADFNEISEPKYIDVAQIYDCKSMLDIPELENYKISLQLHCMERLIKRNRAFIEKELS